MKRQAEKLYNLWELENRIDLQGVADEIGWGHWCQDNFRDQLFQQGYVCDSVIAHPLFNAGGECTEIKVVATII